MTFVVLTFVTFFGGIWAIYWLFVARPEEQAIGKVRKRLAGPKRGKAAKDSRLLKQVEAMSSVRPLDSVLKRSKLRFGKLQTLIQQAGVARMTVGMLLLGTGCLALMVFIAVMRLTGWPLLGVPAGLLVSFIPFNVLRYMRTRRMRKFEEQFPEALDLLSRALRAGHAFTTGIEMVGNELPDPIGPEFRILYAQQNYGMPLPDALRVFGERIPVLDARFFVTAVLTQRESGGNLSEILDNLAGVIRERFRVKRQMRVISAHGRITGWVLVCLPPALGIALMTVNEQHRRTMFGDPLGIQMMIGAVVLQVIGTLIMRKIINIEY